MNRRETTIALVALALAPFTAKGQGPEKIRRIALIGGNTSNRANPTIGVNKLGQAMRELGYVEGRNLVIESRYTDGRIELVPKFATELINRKVEVFILTSTPAVIALQKAVRGHPIVFVAINDPVESGIVSNLARPGANATGLSLANNDFVTKQLELLSTITPKLTSVAFLTNPDNRSLRPALDALQGAAQRVGVGFLTVEANSHTSIERGFAIMKKKGVGAVIVASDNVLEGFRQLIGNLALENHLPSSGPYRLYVEAKCLMSYGASLPALWGRAATYVDKILKGANPGDLPVEQPTVFELFINRNTAKALGITIPQAVLVRADEVIE